MSNLNGLTCPPNVPGQPSGTFTLYRDNNWQSDSLAFNVTDYMSGQHQDISGSKMQDAATWVAYNLPPGVVVTLMDNVTSLAAGQLPGDLRDAGRSVDLVGTGQTEGFSLIDCNMNDCVSCFFWRNVDMNLGAVILYEDDNFGGNRSILFLSEWPSNTIYSIDGWYLNNRVSSINWNPLNDRQEVGFYDNDDGSGRSYANVKGWGTFKQITSLSTVNFNDCMSSFKWTGLAPKMETIDAINMNLTFAGGSEKSLSQVTDYRNEGDQNQNFTASFSDTESQTLTVTSTETVVTGFEISYTQSWKISDGVAELGGSLTLKLTQTYTTSKSTSTSQTQTIALAFSEICVAVPRKVTHANLTAQLGTVAPTTYTTTAHRWYDQPVSGAVQDPANNNWWKRDEKITGYISGGLAGKTNVDLSLSPL